jgi:hypothetical protein
MKHRKLFCIWVVVLIVAGILGRLGWIILHTSSPRITKDNFAKIHDGMTPVEVDAILGTRQYVNDVHQGYAFETWYVEALRVPPWTAEQAVITVTFDEEKSSHHIVVKQTEMRVRKVHWMKRLTDWMFW